MNTLPDTDDAPHGRLIKLLCLLWLVGAATRITILSVPPVLPLIHDDLHMSETQVGLLMALPLMMFAIASVPGSLLVARIGVLFTVVGGLAVTAVASAARGAAVDVLTLYAATVVMGFGVAIIQPALPQLVQQWMPERIALGTAVYTNGILIGTTTTAALTIPVVLPHVDHSWRYALVLWTLVVVVTALVLMLLAPRRKAAVARADVSLKAWWPDWTSPVIWQLGLGFAANNSIYFGANAFLPDYLAAQGRSDLISSALGWINGGQLIASFVLLAVGQRLHRRAWPFLVFGAAALASLVATMFASGGLIVLLAATLGFSTSITYVMLLALPAVLSAPQDVHRTAAGMFTIAYACGVVIPTVSGALWDLSGAPWTVFIPFALCAVVLVVVGVKLAQFSAYRH
jgi:MFS transporter, CP family, cyanate transporter